MRGCREFLTLWSPPSYGDEIRMRTLLRQCIFTTRAVLRDIDQPQLFFSGSDATNFLTFMIPVWEPGMEEPRVACGDAVQVVARVRDDRTCGDLRSVARQCRDWARSPPAHQLSSGANVGLGCRFRGDTLQRSPTHKEGIGDLTRGAAQCAPHKLSPSNVRTWSVNETVHVFPEARQRYLPPH